ncbi:MAG: PQQ-binding-like beta-propeller repeat protein [Planctomycetota bacterium]
MSLSERTSSFFDKQTTAFLAAVSGVMSAVVIVGLVYLSVSYRPEARFADNRLNPDRETIKQAAEKEPLIETYRADDIARRQTHFRYQRKINTGAYFLFVSIFVFAMSMRRLAALTAPTPVPVRRGEEVDEAKERDRAMVSVVAVTVPVVMAVFVGIVWSRGEVEPEKGAPPPEGMIVAAGPTVPDNLKWPTFRGPTGQGIVPEMDLPVSWDAKTGGNILWKTEIPLPGHSSPIVWGDKIFLTGADLKERKVFCLDRASGKLLWECKIQSGAVLGEDFEIYQDTGLAASTPATDGERVVALFGTAELAAVDFSGKQVWVKWFGPPHSAYGLCTSLRMYEGKVILQLDQGGKRKPKSVLYAINPADGKTVWETKRDVGASWSSPLIIKTPQREEIITCADPFVVSYDPMTGKELWRADALGNDVAPVPAYADDMVYTVTESAKLSAIRAGGSGDVTKTHVAWTFEDGLPDCASPLTDGKYLLMAAAGYGCLTCVDAKTGKKLWQQDCPDMFWSSPTLVGRRVFITDIPGKTHILDLSDEYKSLGKGDVGEKVYATPAFVDSKIYLRGERHLFCIGKKQ